MDHGEQLEVDDNNQSIDCDTQLVAGWSSTRRKVESVAEKVAWSSSSVGLIDCKDDDELSPSVGVTSSVVEAASSSKYSSEQRVTESFVDDVVDDGEGGSLIIVHNRSARRMETHTESIVTRKIRSRVIEIDDDDHDTEGGLFEEEQLISALSSSSIEDEGNSSPNSLNDSPCIEQSPLSSHTKSIESGCEAALSLTKSCWSSTVTESIESIDGRFVGQVKDDDDDDDGEDKEKKESIEDEYEDNDDDDVVNDDLDEDEKKLNQQVWSRIEKIRDEYEKSSSSLLLSSSQSHNHQIWSSIHSESIESTESTEFISTTSSGLLMMNEERMSHDYDDGEDDNNNMNSRDISSRCNSNEDNDDNYDDASESDKEEVAISIRRPSLSLVKAEAYVFRSRKSLEELETEIVIRKKRKPKVNKEMVETATIFIANSDTSLIKETSSSPSSSSSLPLSSISMIPISENRRDNLIESLTKHGSLDTETDSNEDDEEIINEQFDDDIAQSPQLAGDHQFHWNRDSIASVFKSDQEINDLF